MDESTQVTVTKPPRRRTRLRYSVRSILLLMTLVACLLAPLMYERNRCEKQSLVWGHPFGAQIAAGFTDLDHDFSIPVRTGLWQMILGDNSGDQVVAINLRSTGPTITSKQMVGLAYLPHLKTLHIRGQQIEASGFPHLADLDGLETLALTRSDVTDDALASLCGLTSLKCLDLRDTKIGNDGAAHLANLINLKTLHLQQTQIGDAGVQHLSKLKNLEHLDLSDTNVSEKSIDLLAQFTSLKLLALNPDTFSLDARYNLRKRLPKCDIIFAKN
jgi:Leucine-rich repeat (LRR) protein